VPPALVKHAAGSRRLTQRAPWPGRSGDADRPRSSCPTRSRNSNVPKWNNRLKAETAVIVQ